MVSGRGAEGTAISKTKDGAHARAQAARAVAAVLAGRSLSDALPPLLAPLPERDRALAQALAFGVLREFEPLALLVDGLIKTRPKPPEVFALLLVGLYQLLYTRIPAHAIVHGTVEGVRRLKAAHLGGLVNGVLRTFMRERERRLAALTRADSATRYALPPWLWQRLGVDWSTQREVVAAALREHPPMTLRVHARKIRREAYVARLHEAGLEARPTRYAPWGVHLAQPQPVERLPGFVEGLVSVQDEAAQLCAELVDLRPGLRVLDACAAPGGKTLALLEREPRLAMLALDVDPVRLERVKANLERAGLTAQILAADAAEPASWWDGQPFDLILLDAPCSASGVIRRHPDIKRLRREADLRALTATQDRLLDALWPLLAPKGRMLYMTCSILLEENEARMAAFLARRRDAQVCPIRAPWGQALLHGRQILPGEEGMDGFYYCLLEKCV